MMPPSDLHATTTTRLQVKVAHGLRDYTLLDSGDGMKLERWGRYTLARPDGQVIWPKLHPERWHPVDALFQKSGRDSDGWRIHHPDLHRGFPFQHGPLQFRLELSPFKHTGVFPEQAANWDWLGARVRQLRSLGHPTRILNLFAYTGGATLACAAAGAEEVAHVDASKPAIAWAKDNLALSNLAQAHVRFLLDDALKFVEREQRRGRTYQGIILDPPVYGRGPKGEKWQIEDTLETLFRQLQPLLDARAGFLLLNAYTTGLSPLGLGNLLRHTFGPEPTLEIGELALPHANDPRLLPTGIYAALTTGLPTLEL